MRTRVRNRLVQTVLAVALLVTGWPLLHPWLPAGPLPVLPLGTDDRPPTLGRVVVDARDSLSTQDLDRLCQEYGLSRLPATAEASAGGLIVGEVQPGQEDATVARLRKDRRVEAADREYTFHALWTPNDPRFKEQWNMRMVGAEKAWDRARGKGVTVAVIDTGVAFEQDDKCYQGKDFAGTPFTGGYDFINNDAHPNDDHGHGTHVAGTIAETTNNGEGVAGLAFEATIMPIKVLDNFGSGTNASIAAGVRFAADHGAQVINMSLGGPFPDQVLHQACQYAAKKGVLIVCAAGNSSGGKVGYPAAFPECLAVSAVGPDGKLAPYSSVGKQVAIAGPGGYTRQGERPEDGVLQNTVRIDDQGNFQDGYYSFNGTSMASPHVAAAAALAISMGVKDPAAVRQLLQRAATKKGPAEQYGAGIMNAAKTVDLAGGARRDSLLLMLFTLVAGITGLGVGGARARLAGLAAMPFTPLGFSLGLLGPDLVFGWIGLGSPFNLLLHSALVPLYLLWEAESRPVYRFVAATAFGAAMHMAWDASRGFTPFAGVLPEHGIPWLWVNAVIGLAVGIVALRRSRAYE